MIKYLGSKRLLLSEIVEAVRAYDKASSCIDLFSGTSRVGLALKRAGYAVTANDHNCFAAILAKCYLEADGTSATLRRVGALITELQRTPPRSGYFTREFCQKTRYFTPTNGAKIDAIRQRIEDLQLDAVTRAVVLTALMEAADRVDSTVGVQMAYLKKWAARAHNALSLRCPELAPTHPDRPCRSERLDANAACRQLSAHVAYLDPPYNQHSYLGNYHVWETLALWDSPEGYGIANKRVDVRTRKSRFNSRKGIASALVDVIEHIDADYIVLSFSNEGYLSYDEVVQMLSLRGPVYRKEIDFRRYVGSQIGIYNLQGEKVGKVSHTRNKECLFATPTTISSSRLRRRLEALGYSQE